MNHCLVQQNAFAACDEMRNSNAISDRKDFVFCPKPRRFGLAMNDPVRPPRLHLSHQAELCDPKARNELLDIILSKGSCQDQPFVQAASPPFFSGSPPSRVTNPLVHDARFSEEASVKVPQFIQPSPSPSQLGARKGCVPSKFGPAPAAVRIEGFNCRDRGSCSIPAVA